MKKLLILLVAACGLPPAEGIEHGLLPVDLQVMQIKPRDSGIFVLPIPDGGWCQHIEVERCYFFTDGGELCVTEDAGCI